MSSEHIKPDNVYETDLAVIGSGPAGKHGAIQAAKHGKRVILIEKEPHLGGASVNTGTLPSKTLRESVLDLYKAETWSVMKRGLPSVARTALEGVMHRKNDVIENEREVQQRQLGKNGIRILYGHARYKDANTIWVETPEHRVQVKTEASLIATGSRPYCPGDIPFDHETILDSDSVLHLSETPKSMIILGTGVIACEYAGIFAAMGVNITMVDQRKDVLGFLDHEILETFVQSMKARGVEFLLGQKVNEVARSNGGVRVELDGGRVLWSRTVLCCRGRSPNTDGMGLEDLGVSLDDRGHVKVNEHFQSSVSNIYAAGDVIGPPSLASASMDQGRIAVAAALGLPCDPFPKLFPFGIYSIPEISGLGMTEKEAVAAGYEVQVGRAYYHECARGHISGETSGLLKLIADAKTWKLLGVHVVGFQAAELVHIGQAVLQLGGTVAYFQQNVFNYPTLAEMYKIAAMNCVNKMLSAGGTVPLGQGA